jgi:hypothetical protein
MVATIASENPMMAARDSVPRLAAVTGVTGLFVLEFRDRRVAMGALGGMTPKRHYRHGKPSRVRHDFFRSK